MQWYDVIASTYGHTETSDAERTKKIRETISQHRLAPGFTNIGDSRYILRPEAIESVFLMWRITGNRKWQDAAWRMFQRIENICRTEVAAAAIRDITQTGEGIEQMEDRKSVV